MPSYSPTGYANAVSIRTARTLLVEGRTDKSVIARLIIELRGQGLLNTDDLVVDTADDIQNLPGARLGNREKVEAIHAQIGGTPRFAGFVDREFRDFDLAPPADRAPHHYVGPPNLFWTRGHSIENYFSAIAFVRATLEQHHPESLPANYVTLLVHAFPSILRECATMSLAALRIQKLDRIREIKSLDLWKVDALGNISVDLIALQPVLAARGISAKEITDFVGFWGYYAPLLAPDITLSQWICHGHLVDSHLWCGVAALLMGAGMPATVATQVAWGTKEAQFRTLSEHWCKSCVAGSGEWPQAFVEWIRG